MKPPASPLTPPFRPIDCSFFFDLQVQVNRAFLSIPLDFDGLVRFDPVKVVQLVEAKNADFPGSLVEQ